MESRLGNRVSGEGFLVKQDGFKPKEAGIVSFLPTLLILREDWRKCGLKNVGASSVADVPLLVLSRFREPGVCGPLS